MASGVSTGNRPDELQHSTTRIVQTAPLLSHSLLKGHGSRQCDRELASGVPRSKGGTQMQLQSRARKLRCCGLSVISLRQSLIFQPLAIMMAILLLPALSWMEGGGAGTQPFQARAQVTLGGCASTTNSIIQNYCLN